MGKYDTVIMYASDESIDKCAALLRQGEVVGMPTETVYGLAGDALNAEAISRIFIAKGRPQDNPLIVHIADISMLGCLVDEIPKVAYKLAEEFWPGPLTMVLKKKSVIPFATSGGLDTVGIRMPSHTVAQKLILSCGRPIAAPSANISGFPSTTTAQHVYNDLKGKIPAIIDGGTCLVGVESTVISFENGCIRLLRPGYISVEDLRRFADVIVDKGVTEKIANDLKVISPGMKYKHYSPLADVAIIEGSLLAFVDYVGKRYNDGTYCVVFDDEKDKIDFRCLTYGNTSEENARKLFDILRELDDLGAKKVYFRCPEKKGVGLAVYNRLLRAAGFEVIKV